MHRILKASLATIIVIFFSLLLLEAVLQLASWYLRQGNNNRHEFLLTDAMHRVVFLGDSHTYGIYLPESDSYPAQLSKMWNEDTSLPKIDVINLGYPGTNSSRILKSLPDVIESLKPDVLVVLVGINDFWMAPVSLDKNETRITRFMDWFRQNSRTFKLIYIVQQNMVNKSKLKVDQSAREWKYSSDLNNAFNEGLRGKRDLKSFDMDSAVQYGEKEFAIGAKFGSEKISEPMPRLRDNLFSIASFAKEKDIKVLFVTYMNNGPLFASVNGQYKILGKKGRQTVLDLSDFYEKNCQSGLECNAYFFPDMHPNAAGYREMAVRIMPALQQLLMKDDR
jgi:lysophospholipase L1-like esterase